MSYREFTKEEKELFQERRKKWIKALESLKYKQGKLFMKKDDCFCPIGIACEIFTEDTGKGEWVPIKQGVMGFKIGENTFINKMPKEVAQYFGLSHWGNWHLPEVNTSKNKNWCWGNRVKISTLNDRGVSFTTIAKHIRRTYINEDES